MALILGCKLGSGIKVGAQLLTVAVINTDQNVQLQMAEKVFNITDQERTEVLPEVWVSLGSGSNTKGDRYCRLAFEAPRSIRIERVDQKQAGLHA